MSGRKWGQSVRMWRNKSFSLKTCTFLQHFLCNLCNLRHNYIVQLYKICCFILTRKKNQISHQRKKRTEDKTHWVDEKKSLPKKLRQWKMKKGIYGGQHCLSRSPPSSLWKWIPGQTNGPTCSWNTPQPSPTLLTALPVKRLQVCLRAVGWRFDEL